MDDSTLLLERAGKAGVVSRVAQQTGYEPVNRGVSAIFSLPTDQQQVQAAQIWGEQLEKMEMERGRLTGRDVEMSAERAREHVESSGDMGEFDFR